MKRGISLIEVTIVIGIVTFLSLGVLMNARVSRQGAVLKDAQATVLLSLERARSRAQTGYGSEDHGVRVEDDKIIIFEGDTYTGSGITILFPPGVQSDQLGSDFIFKRLTAEPSIDGTITLQQSAGNTLEITVEPSGVIHSN